MAHLLGGERLHLEYPTRVVFDEVTIGLDEGDRVGIVGRNGDGKSTLLRLLAGRLEPNAGRVTRRRGIRVGMLDQADTVDPDHTVAHAVVGGIDEHEWAGDARTRDVIGGLLAFSGVEGQSLGPIDLSNLPAPGVGWPLFFLFGIIYFAMGYLLLGSVFLAIGSLATTVREVQTLSMPVTMMQVLLFFFATYAMARTGDPIEWLAIAFPFSSPFVMLARAAQDSALWPHVLAVIWQLLWVMTFIRFGAALFRKRVMKSGPQGVKRNRKLGTLLKTAFRAGSETAS